MATSKKLLQLILVVAAFAITSCSQNTISQTSTDPNVQISSNEVKPQNLQHLSLADYLRRVPGVTIGRTDGPVEVRVRSLTSVNNENNSPLFVIDKTIIGNSYAQAEQMVDPNDIQSVLVLKDPSETAHYGMRGAAGVILIKTKK